MKHFGRQRPTTPELLHHAISPGTKPAALPELQEEYLHFLSTGLAGSSEFQLLAVLRQWQVLHQKLSGKFHISMQMLLILQSKPVIKTLIPQGTGAPNSPDKV